MIKRSFIIFIGLLCLFPAAAFSAWYTNSTNNTLIWPYRQKITISGASVEATLTNFPVLIKITDATNDVFKKAQSNGQDILFTASDEVTKLNHEMDYFSTTGSSMCAWVKMPTLVSTSDSVIYMYYGSSTAPDQSNKNSVWDSNYKAIWHLSEGGTGTRFDSTSNARDGTPQHYTSTTEVIGIIGPADKIWKLGGTAATSQYITFDATDSSALNCSTGESLTISCWIIVAAFDTTWQSIFNKGDSSWRLQRDNANSNAEVGLNFVGGSGYDIPVTKDIVTDGGWHYVVGVYDTSSGNGTVYVDGTWEATSATVTNGYIYDTYPVDIGFNSQQTGRGFNGTVDEVRVSKVNRGRSWVRTEYKNQGFPSGFFSLSAVQYRPSATLISEKRNE